MDDILIPLLKIGSAIFCVVVFLGSRKCIGPAKHHSDETLPSDYEIENDLPKKLMAFWRSKGCDVESVWAERIIWPNGGISLGVDFFPGDSCFSRGKSRGLEDAVKWLMYYLVKKGYARGVDHFRTIVLVHRFRNTKDKIALTEYHCGSDRLRRLERRQHSLLHPLSRMKATDMMNSKRIRNSYLYSKYLDAGEYPQWMDDDLQLVEFLLRCMWRGLGGVGGDWLKLSEAYLIVRKVTKGHGVSDDAAVERTIGIIRYLLENGLAQAGEVTVHHDEEKEESYIFHDSTLAQDELLSAISEEIRRFSANETGKTTLWLRDTEKSEDFKLPDSGESESQQRSEWYRRFYTDYEIGMPPIDDGLHLDMSHFGWGRWHMRYKSKLRAMFSRRRYICSCAVYGSKETKFGWIKTATGMERPFILRVFIWDEDDMITRPNALCIARVSGCIRLNGNTEVKIEYEKGEGKLKVDIVDTPIHETAKNIRLRYKGAETLVRLPADMAEQKENDRARE